MGIEQSRETVPRGVGRRRWHPVTVAGGLAVCAAAAAVIDATGTVAAPVALWLSMGAAAGFATSGST